MKRSVLLSTVTLAILTPTMLQAQATDPAAASSQPVANVEPGDILVTAQRRSERLQDVPVAVTALSSKSLVSRGITDVVDIMGSVPNMHASNNPGQSSAVSIFIRGVGETESIATVDTPVGVYVDDVYIARQGVNNTALFDIDRVEVLRGPQGTLYGRNTSAGALKIVTTKPQYDFGATVEGNYGRFDAWSLKGAVNVPIVSDKVAIRASAVVGGGGAYDHDVTLDKDVNGAKTAGGRIALRLDPTEKLEINISGDYARTNENGTYGVDIAGVLRPTTGSIYKPSSGQDIKNVGQAGGVTGTAEWKLADNMSLKSITAWRETKQKYNIDFSDQPVPVYAIYSAADSKQFSEELQFSGNLFDDRLNFVIGLYYFHENAQTYLGDQLFQTIFFNKNFGVKTNSYAAFAQLSFKITDKLSIIGGGRYTKDHKVIGIVQRLGSVAGFVPNGEVIFDTADLEGQVIAARPGKPVSTNLTFKKFTPKIGLEYKPDRNLLLYATYTQGFKSGGWSARVTSADQFFDFSPETINSYELGAKSTILGGKATVNLTGFYYDYKNLFNSGTTEDGSFGVVTGNAQIYGVELETNWRVADGISVYANGAYEHGKRTSVSAATLVVGSKLQRTPTWSGVIGTNIRRPLNDKLDFMVNGEYSYTGQHYINPQNTPAGHVNAVNLVDASIGVVTKADKYSLAIQCKNCFGEKYLTQILDYGSTPGFNFTEAYAGPRATWMLTARIKY